MIEPSTARVLWRQVEMIHAVTYFADECRAAATAAGCRGFWMGYFGTRAAPMGRVDAGAVIASFANFDPSMVMRAVPDVWDLATPAALLEARASSAAAVLRDHCRDIDTVASGLVTELIAVVEAGDPTGRPLFAANQSLPPRRDPVESLWQCCTSIREHRGDGHIAAFVAEGLSGLDSHLLQAGVGVVPSEALQSARGWSDEAWSAATSGLVDRGLLDADGSITSAGAAVKARIESTTDRLAAVPWGVVDEVAALLDRLQMLADGIREAGPVPVPNPIGVD